MLDAGEDSKGKKWSLPWGVLTDQQETWAQNKATKYNSEKENCIIPAVYI